MDKLRAQSTVPDLALDVVGALLGQMDLAHMQRQLAVNRRCARKEDGPMFIPVTWKQVAHEGCEMISGDAKRAFVRRGLSPLKSSRDFENLCRGLLQTVVRSPTSA